MLDAFYTENSPLESETFFSHIEKLDDFLMCANEKLIYIQPQLEALEKKSTAPSLHLRQTQSNFGDLLALNQMMKISLDMIKNILQGKDTYVH